MNNKYLDVDFDATLYSLFYFLFSHQYIEYRDRLVKLAHRMFKLAYPDQ